MRLITDHSGPTGYVCFICLSHCCCRSCLAPHHVDEPHHRSQFQEAPRVCRKSELREQQVWAVSAAQRREWVRYCEISIICHFMSVTFLCMSLLSHFKRDYISKLMFYASTLYLTYIQDGCSWKRQGLQMMFSPIHCVTPAKDEIVDHSVWETGVSPYTPKTRTWNKTVNSDKEFLIFFTHEFVDMLCTYCVTQ